MPRPKSLVPSYRRHAPSGQAVVTIDGRDHYLGAFNTPASRSAYRRLIAEILANESGSPQQQATPIAAPPTIQYAAPAASPPPTPTIVHMVAEFWRIADRQGWYMKNGKPTTTRATLRHILQVLVREFGDWHVGEFGPLALDQLREVLAEPLRAKAKGKLTRNTINSYAYKIRNVFRRCAEFEIVPAEVYSRLKVVSALTRSKCAFVRETPKVAPVDRATVDATIKHATPDVVAMVELQWHSGARPGEVLNMRTKDIDRTDPEAWRYVPATHKTEHRDRDREVWLGPKAIEVLRPWLLADPAAFLFPLAQMKQPVAAYAKAVRRACIRAGVPAWAPNALRHARATEIRKKFGLEAAQVALGHSNANITQVYAERDRDLARRVAKETG